MAAPVVQTAGIKIAQPGFDVRTCPDYELIFNSSWPTIAIALDQTVTVPSSGRYTFTHNLGFYPLAMAWPITSSSTSGRIFPNITKTTLIFSGLTVGQQINIKCYNLDISGQQNYQYLQSAQVAQPYDSTYGIKITKQNKNINSLDLRDYILHSRAASPMVLSIVTEQSGLGVNLSYTNPQGYVPWVFGYAGFYDANMNPYYVWAGLYNQAYPSITITSATVTMTLLADTSKANQSNGKGSLILLRDPLFTSTNVSVTY